MLSWTRTAPRRWVAALGPLTVELLLAGGEVAAFVWRGGVLLGEVDLGAARAGALLDGMVGPAGLEPATAAFRGPCSAS